MKNIYKVNSLNDNIIRNNLKVISTFSGGGGSSTGYKLAGYDVLWANEFITSAQETYSANHKNVILDKRDIREIKGSEILKTLKLSEGDIDIFDGSPPCASFSTAGKRDKHWGKKKSYSDNSTQVVDDLFFEYIRLLKELNPKVFIAENVSGLVKGVAKGYFKIIFNEFIKANYNVSAKLLNAAWLGVPQARERIIFIGIRKDLKLNPVFPKPLNFQYSIKDACPWISINYKGEIPFIEKESYMHNHATGKEWKKLNIGEQSKKYFQLVRSSPYLPVGTITASGGNAGLASVSHPYECRKFSIAEIKRLCGFPDDYILLGSYSQQYERCGRSVPPIMMKAISEEIYQKIFKEL